MIQSRSTQALDLGVRDGTDRHRRRLHVARTHLRCRDDHVFADGDVQGEGHAGPFASLHPYPAMRPLETDQFRRDLIVACRKARKREVALGSGFRRAVDDTPHRHADAGQPRTSLVGNRTGHLSGGLRRCGRSQAYQRQDRGDQPNPALHAKMYIIPPMSWVSNGLRGAALAGVLASGVASGGPVPVVRQVLVLQSFDRGNLIVDSFTGHFRVELDQRAGTPVNVVQVVVGPIGFVGAPEREVVDYIRALFAGRTKPDLIMTVAGPATVFARKLSTATLSRHAAPVCGCRSSDF